MDSNNTEKMFSEGKNFIAAGNYENALKLFEKAIELDQNVFEIWYHKGICLSLIGKDREAIHAFKKAIELDPHFFDVWNAAGISYINLGIYEEAAKSFENAIRINENIPIAWSNKGLALLRSGKYDEALKAVEKAIELQPDAPFLWNTKGVIFLHTQRVEEALEAFETEIENTERILQNPELNEYLFFGSCSFEKGYSPTMNIGSIDDTLLLARNNKAVAFLGLQRHEEALRIFESILEFNENYPPALIGKGIALYMMMKHSEALIAFDRTIKVDSKNTAAFIYSAQIYFENAIAEKASEMIENGLKVEKDNPILWSIRGRVKIEEQKYREAVDSFNKAMSLDIDNKNILLWKIYANYLEAELSTSTNKARYQDAISSIIRELEKIHKPEYDSEIKAYVCYFLGHFYYKLNDFYTAKERLEECLSFKSTFNKKNTAVKSLMKSADELLSKIWDYSIRPHWWDWWLCSPVNTIRRRVTFVVLISSILTLSLLHPLIGQLYDNISWNIFILLILFFVFILVSPSITRVRSTDLEIEMQEPLKMELSTVQIEDLINQFEMESLVEIK